MHELKPTPPPARPETGLDRNSAGIVLIVDDIPENLAVLHDALDESGYIVLVATNGESALQRAAQALPDIVHPANYDAVNNAVIFMRLGV